MTQSHKKPFQDCLQLLQNTSMVESSFQAEVDSSAENLDAAQKQYVEESRTVRETIEKVLRTTVLAAGSTQIERIIGIHTLSLPVAISEAEPDEGPQSILPERWQIVYRAVFANSRTHGVYPDAGTFSRQTEVCTAILRRLQYLKATPHWETFPAAPPEAWTKGQLRPEQSFAVRLYLIGSLSLTLSRSLTRAATQGVLTGVEEELRFLQDEIRRRLTQSIEESERRITELVGHSRQLSFDVENLRRAHRGLRRERGGIRAEKEKLDALSGKLQSEEHGFVGALRRANPWWRRKRTLCARRERNLRTRRQSHEKVRAEWRKKRERILRSIVSLKPNTTSDARERALLELIEASRWCFPIPARESLQKHVPVTMHRLTVEDTGTYIFDHLRTEVFEEAE